MRMAYRSRKEIDAEFDDLNAAADAFDPAAERSVFNAMMSETGESSRYRREESVRADQQREVMKRAMMAEFSKPNPVLNAVLEAKRPLEFDYSTQELIVDGKRIPSAELEASGAKRAMEKVYQDAARYGTGYSRIVPGSVYAVPKKPEPKKTALLDHVELDL